MQEQKPDFKEAKKRHDLICDIMSLASKNIHLMDDILNDDNKMPEEQKSKEKKDILKNHLQDADNLELYRFITQLKTENEVLNFLISKEFKANDSEKLTAAILTLSSCIYPYQKRAEFDPKQLKPS